MVASFVFYDTETTGLNPGFDQVVQFAAIHTDSQFRKISEINIRCRRRKHIVPSPTAMLITQTAPKVLEEQQYSHFEMASIIHSWIEENSPAIWIGHNNILFDESFLRQTFYQNVMYPYQTQRNGNVRSDTMILSQALAHYHPTAISIPHQNGRHKFKLGMLAEANSIVADPKALHDAYYDVTITLQLAKLIRHKSSAIWDNMMQNADPQNVVELLQKSSPLSVSGFVMGRPYSYLAVGIGENPHNKNEYALANLSISLPSNSESHSSRAISLIESKQARLIRVNKLPIVFSDMTSSIVSTPTVSKRTLERYRTFFSLKQNKMSLSSYFDERKNRWIPKNDVEENIYHGLFSTSDQERMKQFKNGDWLDRATLSGTFEDDRLNELSHRLICEYAPTVVPRYLLKRYQNWIKSTFNSGARSSRRSIKSALEEAEELRSQYPDRQSEIRDIVKYVKQLASLVE